METEPKILLAYTQLLVSVTRTIIDQDFDWNRTEEDVCAEMDLFWQIGTLARDQNIEIYFVPKI